jgi:hypothetical protein
MGDRSLRPSPPPQAGRILLRIYSHGGALWHVGCLSGGRGNANKIGRFPRSPPAFGLHFAAARWIADRSA